MRGQYIHEKTLGDAYKRLYYMGNRPVQTKHIEGFEDGLGSVATAMGNEKALQRMRQQKAEEALRKRYAEEAAAPEEFVDRQDVDFIKGQPWDAEKSAVAAGREVPGYGPGSEPPDPFKVAMDQQKVNQAADLAPINGKYSFNGLDQAHKDAVINGNDRAMMRGLMGTGVANSVPDVDERYPRELFPGRGY